MVFETWKWKKDDQEKGISNRSEFMNSEWLNGIQKTQNLRYIYFLINQLNLFQVLEGYIIQFNFVNSFNSYDSLIEYIY
jgi:hypothetical protein